MPRVVASIEARMGSTRLPGKVLAEIAGKPALQWMVERLKRATSLHAIVLATTTELRDDVLEAFARSAGIACFRGSEGDVLGRVVAAHRKEESDAVVALCGDCPLVDPAIVDRAVGVFRKGGVDLATTAGSGYPQGTEVQVVAFDVLDRIAATVFDAPAREHVTLHVVAHPDRFRIVTIVAEETKRDPDLRLLLDDAGDLAFLDRLCRRIPLHAGVAEIIAKTRGAKMTNNTIDAR